MPVEDFGVILGVSSLTTPLQLGPLVPRCSSISPVYPLNFSHLPEPPARTRPFLQDPCLPTRSCGTRAPGHGTPTPPSTSSCCWVRPHSAEDAGEDEYLVMWHDTHGTDWVRASDMVPLDKVTSSVYQQIAPEQKQYAKPAVRRPSRAHQPGGGGRRGERARRRAHRFAGPRRRRAAGGLAPVLHEHQRPGCHTHADAGSGPHQADAPSRTRPQAVRARDDRSCGDALQAEVPRRPSGQPRRASGGAARAPVQPRRAPPLG